VAGVSLSTVDEDNEIFITKNGIMKKILLAVVFLIATTSMGKLFAQVAEDDIQIIQGAWGKQKRELVSIAMDLTAADSAKFWPVYYKYEESRKKLGR